MNGPRGDSYKANVSLQKGVLVRVRVDASGAGAIRLLSHARKGPALRNLERLRKTEQELYEPL